MIAQRLTEDGVCYDIVDLAIVSLYRREICAQLFPRNIALQGLYRTSSFTCDAGDNKLAFPFVCTFLHLCFDSEGLSHSIVQCMDFGRWRSQRSWLLGLLGVVKWLGISV